MLKKCGRRKAHGARPGPGRVRTYSLFHKRPSQPTKQPTEVLVDPGRSSAATRNHAENYSPHWEPGSLKFGAAASGTFVLSVAIPRSRNPFLGSDLRDRRSSDKEGYIRPHPRTSTHCSHKVTPSLSASSSPLIVLYLRKFQEQRGTHFRVI